VKDGKPHPRLLLVDDEPDNLEVFGMLLAQKFSVFGYTSAMDALDAIDAVRPDIVVLDIGMQPIDGLECLARIRSMPQCRDVPAVAVTGFARDIEREEFLDGGFQAVLVKPVLDYDGLFAGLERLVASRAAAAAAPPHLDERGAGASLEAREPGAEERRSA
jgi:CheY-like chemotaxis protein